MTNNTLKVIAKNVLIFILPVMASVAFIALTGLAQTTQTTYFSYDNAKQLVKAGFVNRSSFLNRTLLTARPRPIPPA